MLKIFKRFYNQLNPNQRKQIYVLISLMFVSSIFESVSVGMVVPFISTLLSPEKIYNLPYLRTLLNGFQINSSSELTQSIIIVFVASAILSGIMRVTMLWYQITICKDIARDLSNKIYLHFLNQPYEVHLKTNSSEVISTLISKVAALAPSVLMPMATISSSMIIVISVAFMLFALNPIVAFVSVIGFGIIYLLVIMLTRGKINQASKSISKKQALGIKILQESLGGIRDIILDNNQDYFAKIYADLDQSLKNSEANVQFIATSPRYLVESFSIVFIALLTYFLSLSEGGIIAFLPILAALAAGAQRLLPLVQIIYANITTFRGNYDTLCNMLDLLESTQNFDEITLPQKLMFENEFILKNITFNYNDCSSLVLDKINFKFKKGDKIGIMGASGAGKSTLIDIIMGLLDPTEGNLIVDGTKIEKKHKMWWMSNIAHVPQSIYLADATISENIAFGTLRSDIDYERVKYAAKVAHIDSAIEQWPLKYDTLVGERGVRLSGGQRQRIGIARALYKSAQIIILDEATSALDNLTENLVMKELNMIPGNLSIIFIAHRLTTLKHCSQIIEIVNGRISRVGSYNDIVGDVLAH